MAGSMKTVVIGIDGASWDLIEPWLQAGDLPNLKHLKENGSWSYSASQLPYVTSPNWKCYSTGKNPGKLGVYWWEVIDIENKAMKVPDSSFFKSRELFDYLSDCDIRCGVINMPTTYPPKKLRNGFMVSGGPGCGSSGYTWPDALEATLKERYGYRPHPSGSVRNRKEYVREVLDLIDKRFEVGKAYLEEVDFLQITIFYINALQHFFYRGEDVKKGWSRIDENIGYFLDKGCNIALLSDHGCGRIDRVFNINTWLQSNGKDAQGHINISGRAERGSEIRNGRLGAYRGFRKRTGPCLS
jgi:predicted AlkP superfamily phosphohydrolase/phosphomutase